MTVRELFRESHRVRKVRNHDAHNALLDAVDLMMRRCGTLCGLPYRGPLGRRKDVRPILVRTDDLRRALRIFAGHTQVGLNGAWYRDRSPAGARFS